jgi:hypothetical protein
MSLTLDLNEFKLLKNFIKAQKVLKETEKY